MRRRRPLVVAAVVAGGGILCGLLFVGARVPRTALVREAEQALGAPLGVAQVRLRFVPQPVVDLVDVRAPDAGVVAGYLTAFDAERVRLRLALGPLLGGLAVVERIDFFGPRLRVVRPAAPEATPPRAAAAADPVRRPRRGTRQSGPRRTRRAEDRQATFRVRRVEIYEGRLQFVDEATVARWAVGRMRATIAFPAVLGNAVEQAHVVVRGALRHQGQSPLATLALQGEVGWAARRPRFRGAIETGPFVYGPLAVDGGAARVQADARGIHVRDLVLRAGRGAVAGRARALFGNAPTIAVSVAGRGAALEEALDDTGVVVRGRWETRLRLRAPAPWRGQARRALRGDGRVVIRAGAIEPFELGSALLDVVAPLRSRKQTRALRRRYGELFAERSLPFRRLSGTFRIEGGRVRTRDLAVRADAYRADGGGTVSVDGRLALGLRLALSPRLTRDLLGDGGFAAIVGAAPGQGLVVPLRLEGTVERPRVRATPQWSRALIRRTLGGSGMGDLLERLLR
jgi:hypothetical protein